MLEHNLMWFAQAPSGETNRLSMYAHANELSESRIRSFRQGPTGKVHSPIYTLTQQFPLYVPLFVANIGCLFSFSVYIYRQIFVFLWVVDLLAQLGHCTTDRDGGCQYIDDLPAQLALCSCGTCSLRLSCTTSLFLPTLETTNLATAITSTNAPFTTTSSTSLAPSHKWVQFTTDLA